MRQNGHTDISREAYYRIDPPGPVTCRRIEDLSPEEQERIRNYKPPYPIKASKIATLAPNKWERNERKKMGRA